MTTPHATTPALEVQMDGLLLLYTLALAGFEGRALDLVAAARAAHIDPVDFAPAVAAALTAFDGHNPIAAARQLAARTDPAAINAAASVALGAYIASTRSSHMLSGHPR